MMYKNESGRSMVEMLGTLAIMGVLTITGVWGYRYAMYRWQAAQILDGVKQRFVIANQQNVLGRPLDLKEFHPDSDKDLILGKYEVVADNLYNNEALNIGNAMVLEVYDIPYWPCQILKDMTFTDDTKLLVNDEEAAETTCLGEEKNEVVEGTTGNMLTFVFGDYDEYSGEGPATPPAVIKKDCGEVKDGEFYPDKDCKKCSNGYIVAGTVAHGICEKCSDSTNYMIVPNDGVDCGEHKVCHGNSCECKEGYHADGENCVCTTATVTHSEINADGCCVETTETYCPAEVTAEHPAPTPKTCTATCSGTCTNGVCTTGSSGERECSSYQDCNDGEYCQFSPSSCSGDTIAIPTTGVCRDVSACRLYDVGTTGWVASDWGGSCSPDWFTAKDICESKGMSMPSLSELGCEDYKNDFCPTSGTVYGTLKNNGLLGLGFWTTDMVSLGADSCRAWYVLSGAIEDMHRSVGDDFLCRPASFTPPTPTCTGDLVASGGSCVCPSGKVPKTGAPTTCVECNSNTDCKNSSKPYCTGSGVCQAERECTSYDTNECGTGYYCHFEAPNCYERGNGVCRELTHFPGYQTTDIYHHWVSSNHIDWWTAYSWCIAKGSTGLMSTDTFQNEYGCNFTDGQCDWDAMISAGLSEGYYTSSEIGDGCRIIAVRAESIWRRIVVNTRGGWHVALCE